eukprot:gene11926-biopygen3612
MPAPSSDPDSSGGGGKAHGIPHGALRAHGTLCATRRHTAPRSAERRHTAFTGTWRRPHATRRHMALHGTIVVAAATFPR